MGFFLDYLARGIKRASPSIKSKLVNYGLDSTAKGLSENAKILPKAT